MVGRFSWRRLLTRRKYKRLVKDVFPRNPHDSQPNDREMERLTVYALTTPDKLPKIGLYLERRVGKNFARREYGHLRVAIQILHALLQACHGDLRLFADSVVRLIKFLMRQDGETELQVLRWRGGKRVETWKERIGNMERREKGVEHGEEGKLEEEGMGGENGGQCGSGALRAMLGAGQVLGCETLMKFASSQDEALQMQSLTQFVDELVRMCHDRQPRPDVRLRIREAGLRAMTVLVQLLDASLSEQFGKLMPGVLANMHVAAGDEHDRRVRDTAFKLFGDICRALKPAIAPFILRPLFAYLDGSNCWTEQGTATARPGPGSTGEQAGDGAADSNNNISDDANNNRDSSNNRSSSNNNRDSSSNNNNNNNNNSNNNADNGGRSSGNTNSVSSGAGRPGAEGAAAVEGRSGQQLGGSFVTECLEQLMASMQPQHNYLVFIEMQQRLEQCSRKAAGSSVPLSLSTVLAVAVIAKSVRGVPGPSYYRMFLAAVDLTTHALTAYKAGGGDEPAPPSPAALSAADKARLLQLAFLDASRRPAAPSSDLPSLKQLVDEGVAAIGELSRKLVNLPQHVEALYEIALRMAAAQDGASERRGAVEEIRGRQGEREGGQGDGEGQGGAQAGLEGRGLCGVVERCVVESLAGVARHGVALANGRRLPALPVAQLLSAAESEARDVRQRALEALESLLCGGARRGEAGESGEAGSPGGGVEAQGRGAGWEGRVSAHQLPQLVAAIVGLALRRDNSKEDVEAVLRCLVRLAEGSPQGWIEHVLPPLLESQRKAAGGAGAGGPGSRASEGKGRGGVEGGESVYVQGMVAGGVLAVARALRCAALEAYVGQVITLRRQAGWGGQVSLEEGAGLGVLEEAGEGAAREGGGGGDGGGEKGKGGEAPGAEKGAGGEEEEEEEEGQEVRGEGGRGSLLLDAAEVWEALGMRRGGGEAPRRPLELKAEGGGGEAGAGGLRAAEVASTTVDMGEGAGEGGPANPLLPAELAGAGGEASMAAVGGGGEGLQPAVLLQRLTRALEERPPEDFVALARCCARAAPASAAALGLRPRESTARSPSCDGTAQVSKQVACRVGGDGPALLPFSFPSVSRRLHVTRA